MYYEKKYKEALERARALRNEAIGKEYAADYIKDYETIFPELRESEEERIRKWIVNLLHELHYNQTSQPMALKAIEYLEKQKEPHYTKRNALFDKCVENCDPEVMKEVSDKVDEMLRKEQKPTDLPPGFYFIDLDGKRYYSKEFRYGDMKMKVVEQKPAEWSEEDMGLIEAIENTYAGYADYLRDDRTRPNDEKRDILNDMHEELRRLKSLRPSWKPSEEQMSMFLAVLNDPNNASAESCHIALISLYNELRKLM